VICCGVERGPRPVLSFTIAREAVVARVEVIDKILFVRGLAREVAPEGTTWMLMPKGFKVWSLELDSEVEPGFGKRFYLSTSTQDPNHFLMEW
jgi:hypothetical protein